MTPLNNLASLLSAPPPATPKGAAQNARKDAQDASSTSASGESFAEVLGNLDADRIKSKPGAKTNGKARADQPGQADGNAGSRVLRSGKNEDDSLTTAADASQNTEQITPLSPLAGEIGPAMAALLEGLMGKPGREAAKKDTKPAADSAPEGVRAPQAKASRPVAHLTQAARADEAPAAAPSPCLSTEATGLPAARLSRSAGPLVSEDLAKPRQDTAFKVADGGTATAAMTQNVGVASASVPPTFQRASATVETTIDRDIHHPAFAPVLSARVATMVREGVEQARVHLNPSEMGPVSLQMSLDGQKVRVDMSAEMAATRAVLEQSLPALANALREVGLTLSAAGVSPSGGETSAGSRNDPGGTGPFAGQAGGDTSSGGATNTPTGRQNDQRSPEWRDGARNAPRDGEWNLDVHVDTQGSVRSTSNRHLVDMFA